MAETAQAKYPTATYPEGDAFEHIVWAAYRAIYTNRDGGPDLAIQSFQSDFLKHPQAWDCMEFRPLLQKVRDEGWDGIAYMARLWKLITERWETLHPGSRALVERQGIGY